jgi:hypothetical protein
MMQKFKTSYLLWTAFSLLLFLPGWFIPWLGKHDTTFAAMSRGLSQRLYSDTLPDLAFFLLLYGLPAAAVGWVLQALVRVFSQWKNKQKTIN